MDATALHFVQTIFHGIIQFYRFTWFLGELYSLFHSIYTRILDCVIRLFEIFKLKDREKEVRQSNKMNLQNLKLGQTLSIHLNYN